MSKPILKVALIAGLAAGVAIAVIKVRSMREVASETVDNIESQLDALDPATKAVVLGKLSADAAKDIKALRS